MKTFRSFLAICITATGALVPSISSAQSVDPSSCQSMMSISMTDQSGTPISGEFAYVEIMAAQDGWEQYYQVDHAITGTGTARFCQLTAAQIAELEQYGESIDRELQAGDLVSASFIPDGSSVVQNYRHVFTQEQASALNRNESISLPNLVASANSQIPVVIRDSSGAIQVNAYWDIFAEIEVTDDGERYTDYRYVTSGTTNSLGAIGIAGLDNGSYRLGGYPGDNPSELSMLKQVSFTISGGVATFEANALDAGVLTLPNGNVRFKFVKPDLSDLSQDTQDRLWAFVDDEDFGPDSLTRKNDNFYVANLPVRGTPYSMMVIPDSDSGFVDTRFEVAVSNSGSTFTKDGNSIQASQVPLNAANLKIRALDVAGNVLTNASFDLFSASTCATEETITGVWDCDNDYRSFGTSSSGTAMLKAEDGDFWIYMRPNGGAFGSAPSLTKAVFVNGATSSSSVTGNGTFQAGQQGELDTITITARTANLKATVETVSGQSLSDGWVRAEKICNCNSNEIQNPDAYIDSTGKFSLLLQASQTSTPVEYKIFVEPYGQSDAATSYFVASVDQNGDVTAVDPPSYLSGTVSGPTSSIWRLKLPRPNVGGVVYMPNGTTPAPHADFQVEQWNSNDEEFRHSNELPYLYADDSGVFSGYFAPGRYQFTVTPPYGAVNVAESVHEIVVDAQNRVCFIVNSTAGSCSTGIQFGALALTLSTPNVTGNVTKAGVALGSDDSVNVQLLKWNTTHEYWQWQRWGQIASDGKYSFNIQEPGTYQISADPSGIAGYSTGFEYLVVGQNSNGLTFCKIPEPALDSVSRATCQSNTVTSGPIQANIALTPANLVLNVNVPQEFDGNINANLYKVYEVPGLTRIMYHGYMNLEQSSPGQVFTGYSALTDNNSNPAKYRLDFTSWTYGQGSVPLAKLTVNLWASNFVAGPGIEICLDADYNKIQETCAAGRAYSSSTPLTVEMGYGNLSGKAVTPTNLPVRYANLNVEEWRSSSFSSDFYYWHWTDNYLNANDSGSFGLNLDDPGFYRITTRQQWGGTLPFSDGVMVIQVDENNDWCVHSGAMPNSGQSEFPTQESCQMSRDNVPSDDITGLTASLATPKISGQLFMTTGDPAVDAWVSLRKWNSTYRYYEHSGWASTNSEGKYYLNPSDGDVQLNFQPSWRNRLTEVGFDKPLCVGAALPSPANERPSDALSTCSQTYSLSDNLLGPNVKGIVCKKNEANCIDSGARYSWIEVRAKGTSTSNDPDYWEWSNKGSSTDMQGKFATYLEPGTDASPKQYSLKVHPGDVSAQGVGKRIVVTLGQTSCSIDGVPGSCADIKINLLSPNVTGQLTFNRSDLLPEDEREVMKNSWLSILSENYTSYVTGSSTNSQGKFAAYLADGTYFVDSYSNSSVAARPSLRITVKVENGVVSWKYRNENSFSTAPIVADFDYVLPNVKVNLSSDFTSSRIILVKDQSVSGTEQPRRFIAAPGTDVQNLVAKGILTQGKSYTFKVIPNYGETLTGTCTSSSIPITEPEGTSSPTIVNDISSCRPG